MSRWNIPNKTALSDNWIIDLGVFLYGTIKWDIQKKNGWEWVMLFNSWLYLKKKTKIVQIKRKENMYFKHTNSYQYPDSTLFDVIQWSIILNKCFERAPVNTQ